MKADALTFGEQWLLETLCEDRSMRGWAMRLVAADEHTRGVIHIALTDRYGRTYRYRMTLTEET